VNHLISCAFFFLPFVVIFSSLLPKLSPNRWIKLDAHV